MDGLGHVWLPAEHPVRANAPTVFLEACGAEKHDTIGVTDRIDIFKMPLILDTKELRLQVQQTHLPFYLTVLVGCRPDLRCTDRAFLDDAADEAHLN
jgi:hypothetical protein